MEGIIKILLEGVYTFWVLYAIGYSVLLKLINCATDRVQVVLWDWSGTVVDGQGNMSSDAFYWINWFNKHNVPQCVISNEMNSRYLEDSVKRLNLLGFFGGGQYIVCAGQNYSPKPTSSMFDASLSRLSADVSPRNVLYIGDSQTDRAFAINCGCIFCPHTELTERPS